MCNKTKRTTIHRAPERAVYDFNGIKKIIKDALIGHVSFFYEGSVHSIPLPFWCIDRHLYCHCSKNSRLVFLEGKEDVCVSFAIIDALVFAKSAFRHSLNYRSVVLYGTFESIPCNREKIFVMKQFVELFDRDRWNKIRPPNEKELNAAAILRLPLNEAVAKMRSGPPNDLLSDRERDVWSGVVPRICFYALP